jgi:hypothetical protein
MQANSQFPNDEDREALERRSRALIQEAQGILDQLARQLSNAGELIHAFASWPEAIQLLGSTLLDGLEDGKLTSDANAQLALEHEVLLTVRRAPSPSKALLRLAEVLNMPSDFVRLMDRIVSNESCQQTEADTQKRYAFLDELIGLSDASPWLRSGIRAFMKNPL